VEGEAGSKTHRMQRMEAECWIFMLFLRLRMLSEDWYTWMLPATTQERRKGDIDDLVLAITLT